MNTIEESSLRSSLDEDAILGKARSPLQNQDDASGVKDVMEGVIEAASEKDAAEEDAANGDASDEGTANEDAKTRVPQMRTPQPSIPQAMKPQARSQQQWLCSRKFEITTIRRNSRN